MASAKRTSVAATYAQAMLDLANQRQQAEEIGQELAEIKKVIEANPTFGLFLRDPAIGEARRQETLGRIFGGRASELVMNLLGVMNSKGRLGLIGQVADEYRRLLDVQLGNIKVDVTVAKALDSAELEQVRGRISQAFKKNAVVHQKVDESIVGGLVVRIEDKLIDGSVKAQLEAMKRQLIAAAPRKS